MKRLTLTIAEYERGMEWLLGRGRSISSDVYISQLRSNLPGLQGMTSDQVLEALNSPTERPSQDSTLVSIDAALDSWCRLQPDDVDSGGATR